MEEAIDSYCTFSGKDVTIGHRVWVGAGCTIGSNAVLLDWVVLANNTVIPGGDIISSKVPAGVSSTADAHTDLHDWLPVVLLYLFWSGLMLALVIVGTGWWASRCLCKRRVACCMSCAVPPRSLARSASHSCRFDSQSREGGRGSDCTV